MKPHVIMIMADQLRADVLGKGFTPNIDSIGIEGVRFFQSILWLSFVCPSQRSYIYRNISK